MYKREKNKFYKLEFYCINFHTGQGFSEKNNLELYGSLNFPTGQGYLRLFSLSNF